ncbi:MAG: efflux transporter outer membrane subunit [Pseudomonadales bacterium]|nr:efflux transporter outer membrane subunit [Pseudomonadales bacterium]MCP5190118.1 efflux transporter outer membrane subunit [Pseudomonadales bacterium]
MCRRKPRESAQVGGPAFPAVDRVGRRRGRVLLAIVVVAGLLHGCTLAPEYQPPPVAVPDNYRFASAEVEQTANTTWWRQLDDPVLDQLIATALAANNNVRIATANVEQALAVVTQTRSALFPQVGYGASGAKDRIPETGVAGMIPNLPNPQETYQAMLSASWELDLWGRIRSLSEAAQASMLATNEARRGVILTLVSSVATSYITLRGLDEQLQVARQSLTAYAESVRIYELQFKHGQTSQMTVAQARSQYETAAARIPQIELQIAQTENVLSVLLGGNPEAIPRGKTIGELHMPAVPAGLPSSLLERRPDLQQAEQVLIAANAQIGAARALYFPSISLTGAYGSVSSDLSDLFKGPARSWSYAGQVTGPLFTFGAVSGQVAQAEAAQRAAVASYELAVESAFADVDNALAARQKLGEQLVAQQRLVAALQDYSRLAQLQYDAGYAPYSTVLQAEQSLFPAQLALAELQASVLSSAAVVYKAMGGGWVGEADKMTGDTLSESVAQPPAVPLF